jgi:hypothetical protein
MNLTRFSIQRKPLDYLSPAIFHRIGAGEPGGRAMTRRELLLNWSRLWLLRWRVVRGYALPAFATALLRLLDSWAVQSQKRSRR